MIIDFGKHKGQSFDSVPANYKSWLMQQDFFIQKLRDFKKTQRYIVMEDFEDFNSDSIGNYTVKKGTILKWTMQYLTWTYYENELGQTVIVRGWSNPDSGKIQLIN